MSDSANSQYSNPPFGMAEQLSTGAGGSGGGATANDQYTDVPDVLGADVSASDLTSTGAPGSDAPTPPHDGSSATVTIPFNILGGSNAPDVSGTTNTSDSALNDPFVHPGAGFGGGSFSDTDTGAGDGNTGSNRVS
jgi:hypothetical protein